jgi:hypothetical protein
MTNDPTYDEQLTLLAQQDFSHPSMDMPLPGNVNAVDRFQCATYAEFGVYNNEYRTVDDLKLGDDSQPQEIDPYDSISVGDVTARFQPQRMPFQSREYAVN